MSRNDENIENIKEAWKILKDKYSTPQVIIGLILALAFLFLPFCYIIIGSLLFSYFIVANINKIRRFSQTDNICEHKYYDLRNPISIFITFVCNFGLLIFNVLYSLLQISLWLLLWSRLNDLHSYADITQTYYLYESSNPYFNVLQKLFFLINLIVSIFPFITFPIFWKTKIFDEYDREYWINRLTKQMMRAIDRPKTYVLTIGFIISSIFGIIFSFIKKPKNFCTDDKYKDSLVSMLKKNAFALYAIIPVIIYVYGDSSLQDIKLFIATTLEYLAEIAKKNEEEEEILKNNI